MEALRFLSYIAVGAVLADGGVTYRGWHLYVVLASIFIIDTASFRRGLRSST